jgi:hypothetical protein
MTTHNDTTKNRQAWNIVEATELADLDPRERVDLDVDDFQKLLKQKGVRLNVYRSMPCPNVKSIDGGEHQIDCPLCNGSGYIDRYPLCVYGFVQNQALKAIQGPEGWHDGNTVAITFPIGVELQYFTLVELVDFNDIFFQRVARSATNTDRLKYRAKRINVLVDQNGVEYFQDNDFALNEYGDIVWKSGKGPLAETVYSVHFECPVRFRATNAVHVNRFTQQKVKNGSGIKHLKLPEMWQLSKEFLVLRRDRSGNEILPNAIPNYTEETPA